MLCGRSFRFFFIRFNLVNNLLVEIPEHPNYESLFKLSAKFIPRPKPSSNRTLMHVTMSDVLAGFFVLGNLRTSRVTNQIDAENKCIRLRTR